MLDEHIKYIKMLRRAEAEAYKSLPSKLLPSSSAKQDLLIDDCSFSAPDGKILCDNGQIHLVYGRKYGLIGKNGAGKTTLLRALAKRMYIIYHITYVYITSPMYIIYHITYVYIYRIFHVSLK